MDCQVLSQKICSKLHNHCHNHDLTKTIGIKWSVRFKCCFHQLRGRGFPSHRSFDWPNFPEGEDTECPNVGLEYYAPDAVVLLHTLLPAVLPEWITQILWINIFLFNFACVFIIVEQWKKQYLCSFNEFVILWFVPILSHEWEKLEWYLLLP